MKKRITSLTLSLILIFTLILPLNVSAEEGEYVIDECEYFSSGEIDELNQKASDIKDETGYNITTYITSTTNGTDIQDAAKEFYDAFFGGEDGVVLIYDEEQGEADVVVGEDSESKISDDVLSQMLNAYNEPEYYYDSVYDYLIAAETFLADGDAGEVETPQTIPDSRLLPRMVDNADILTDEEEAELEGILDEISERQQLDVVVATVDSLEGKTPMEYADDFYDYNGYGFGENKDGVILLLSMEARDWWISTTGYGITVFTDAGIQYLSEKFLPYFGDDEYMDGFKEFATWSDQFITQANEDEPYDSGSMPKEKAGIKWVGYSILIGFMLSFIIACIKRSSMKSIVQQHSAAEYTRPGSVNMTYRNDRFIRKHTTSRKIEKSSSSSGSSTHTSSSGSSHGGGGGKF